jgi:hypothetical protein
MQVDAERREGWRQALEAAVAAVQDNLAWHPTGLFPDFVEYDFDMQRWRPVAGKVLERARDGAFCWNACRRAAVWQLVSCQSFQHAREWTACLGSANCLRSCHVAPAHVTARGRSLA